MCWGGRCVGVRALNPRASLAVLLRARWVSKGGEGVVKVGGVVWLFGSLAYVVSCGSRPDGMGVKGRVVALFVSTSLLI